MPMFDNAAEMQEVTAMKIGNYYKDNYLTAVKCSLQDGEFSYIEQLFMMALRALIQLCPIQNANHVDILPQFPVDKYRIDFMLVYKGKNLVIELDGHEFHDKNEKQRRYEKARDRFLSSKNYKVIHYTGKEITDNPFIPAKESLEMALGLPKDLLNYGF